MNPVILDQGILYLKDSGLTEPSKENFVNVIFFFQIPSKLKMKKYLNGATKIKAYFKYLHFLNWQF